MQTQLRTRLLSASPVSALVGTRINWGARPQGEAYPSLVLTLISDPRPQHFAGLINSRSTMVQIDCYGTTAAQAAALREAVISAIVPAATVGGVIFDRAFIDMVRNINSHSETGIVYRDIIEARVWHRSN
jgi:hypothetical protein